MEKIPQVLTSAAKKAASLSVEELWKLQTTIWDNFLYPANVKQIQSINSTLFAPNIQGRVDITRTFDGAELNTEYIFGLFADPTKLSLIGVPVSYNITKFAATDNIVSASTVFMFNATMFGKLIPITIDTFTTFDPETKQLTQYDATFKWMDFLFAELYAEIGTLIHANSTDQVDAYLTNIMAQTLCEAHSAHCTGADQQYADATSCYNYLTTQVRLGQVYELGRNTLWCRLMHAEMLQYRPSVHCPHVGPSGGGMCVDDQTYAEKVLQNYFTNSPFIPSL
ncbi:uncharacterized protein THITE_2144873 [Thermothielavioides terrestris NRRL 8126]|uniref:Uncharacterized protein n=1 Tax=Thermothielavioides terrestris (strain ATCC 38088 / NRRL 8126) TaxID=578455 RepID=G2R5U4_THETT|nr:uncharacterized protein THITE_2144873 [Thermothielavioides terrestris NRRL 8126]AEO67533.1 hypothetical protein THITE_2144873 [Thermothielavioides terrestris NRRL 8126]